MVHFVYILHSKTADKFYIGETENLTERLELHNSETFKKATTKVANDWKVFFSLEVKDRTIARKVETHIKKMKSRKYFESIKSYPEIGEKLIAKYST